MRRARPRRPRPRSPARTLCGTSSRTSTSGFGDYNLDGSPATWPSAAADRTWCRSPAARQGAGDALTRNLGDPGLPRRLVLAAIASLFGLPSPRGERPRGGSAAVASQVFPSPSPGDTVHCAGRISAREPALDDLARRDVSGNARTARGTGEAVRERLGTKLHRDGGDHRVGGYLRRSRHARSPPGGAARPMMKRSSICPRG